MYFPEIRKNFLEILSNRPYSKQLLSYLEEQGQILLFGGCIREYFDTKYSILPRDFDIVLHDVATNTLENFLSDNSYNVERNKFGGYKIMADDLKFDIWELQNTWAFKARKISFNEVKDLNKTVFLNIDAVHYNLTTEYLSDDGYETARKYKTLDIVLKDNPFPELNFARAIRLMNKYDLTWSENLSEYFNEWVSMHPNKSDAIEKIKQIEVKRYNECSVDWLEKAYDLVLN
ncbi:hypothetical protein [Brevibacillus formosus]|uniref:hypothetical protein n=1 Tax=Brevibacillus formosus TaxID=54913 RepID=UPI003F1E236A